VEAAYPRVGAATPTPITRADPATETAASE
jgi:hypothetical protein